MTRQMDAPSTSTPYRPGDVARRGHVMTDLLHRQADAVNDQIAAVDCALGRLRVSAWLAVIVFVGVRPKVCASRFPRREAARTAMLRGKLAREIFAQGARSPTSLEQCPLLW